MTLAKRVEAIIREPLCLFVLGAGMLFVLENSFTGKDKQEFVVSEAVINSVLEQHRNLKGRDITEQEKNRAIDEYVNEELLLKEAYRRGLDVDHIIRTRMLRKLRFLYTAEQGEPNTNELKAYYRENPNEFIRARDWDIQQIYYDRESVLPDDLLAVLNAGADPSAFGQIHGRFPTEIKGIGHAQVMARFGKFVTDALKEAKTGVWLGPLISPHGFHFVKVTTVHQGQVEPYNTVENYVKNAWKQREKTKKIDAHVRWLRQQYDIRIERVQPS